MSQRQRQRQRVRVGRVMGLRGGKNANALSLRIKPLSLEHEGRTQFCRCARSCGIIGGSGRPISDSLAVGGWVRVRQRWCEGETGETRARQRKKKFSTKTGETYRYPYVRITASAVWCCRIFLVRGVLVIGAHHVTRCSIMGIIVPMKPTVEGSGPGRREQRDVGVGVVG